MAGASDISANGMCHFSDKYSRLTTLDILKENNLFYFTYELYNNLQSGKSRSESFTTAKKLYVEELLKHTDLEEYENYQTNFIGCI